MSLHVSSSAAVRHDLAALDRARTDDTATHTVSPGETLSGIARRHGTSVERLLAANPHIGNPDLIFAGDTLRLPSGATGGEHEIRPGDTLEGIAARAGVDVDALARLNGIVNPDLIYAGDTLRLPADRVTDAPAIVELAPEGMTPVAPVSDDPAPVAVAGDAPATPSTTAADVDYQRIVGVAGNPNVTPAFIAEVEAMAARLGARPEHILAVMSFETGGSFSPSQPNLAGSGATGLIQFMPATARGLGTSTAALASMTPLEQLPWVEAYFAQYPGRLGTLEGVYSSVLSGRAIPDPNDTLPNFVAGHRNYAANAGLDFDGDGRVTSGEATSAVAARLYGGIAEVQRQLVDAGAVSPGAMDGFVDGRFGPGTSAAIARFQEYADLPSTGMLDDTTGQALFAAAAPSTEDTGTPGAGYPDLDLSRSIAERGTSSRSDNVTVSSPVLGDFIVTEGFMSRGGPHSEKSARLAIYADVPGVAEPVAAGVYNLGIDYVTLDGRIRSWFDGEVQSLSYSERGYGNRLIMRSDLTYRFEGRDYPIFAHYAHADGFDVGVGDRVSAGQDIGDQGSTGGSTGDHVDFLTWIELDGGQRIYLSPNLLDGGG